ncbi:MAG: CRISPR-associated protein Cas4 [Clostridiales bacterium GWE2_32_10]|nr:MAG: CRISPR-associated protein Cas4 [Clostridiales bacterium GWE2_32_10]HBY20026.1 CRISPR-associated protein Cas4 [Clostridiales bacterium]
MKKVTGIMIYYYFVCKRKLWYFVNDIQMENENEDVMIGKLIDENSYERQKKHILIDETINVDFIRDYKVVHEVKKSRSIEKASIWQLKYYLYYLKNLGMDNITGEIDYPLLRKREKVVLTEDDIKKFEEILEYIKNIKESTKVPGKIDNKICKKCAYFELCYI